ncbi:hypothetical protein BO71DRAFT_435290 [Aspergillus ellipticus CBS 707.79]|uniref:Uncharacterized protein n=1 Tax=Aspergillus ellipticus CBS 707.79 TaxID=1448320 RepID=A0A319CVR0_9EURO|nr:hypothetical protein BO71DRAFT_435290 [Aspergillus ellipticus CBS 707.79]
MWPSGRAWKMGSCFCATPIMRLWLFGVDARVVAELETGHSWSVAFHEHKHSFGMVPIDGRRRKALSGLWLFSGDARLVAELETGDSSSVCFPRAKPFVFDGIGQGFHDALEGYRIPYVTIPPRWSCSKSTSTPTSVDVLKIDFRLHHIENVLRSLRRRANFYWGGDAADFSSWGNTFALNTIWCLVAGLEREGFA